MESKSDQVAQYLWKYRCATFSGPFLKRIDLFIYFGRPLADFECPFGTLSVPIGLIYKINDSSPQDSVRFCQYLAVSGCPQRPASKGFGGRPDVTMGPQIDQAAPNNSKKASVHLKFGVPGTDLLPESIRIEAMMIYCRFMIDFGSLFCNFVKSIVLGTHFKQNLAHFCF